MEQFYESGLESNVVNYKKGSAKKLLKSAGNNGIRYCEVRCIWYTFAVSSNQGRALDRSVFARSEQKSYGDRCYE